MESTQQMFEGSWTCADCGKEITQLPFKPEEGRPVYCRDCHQKIRDRADSRRPRDFGNRKMVQGDWKCSKCGTEIKELPFRPIPGREIYCRECWRKMRQDRF